MLLWLFLFFALFCCCDPVLIVFVLFLFCLMLTVFCAVLCL